MRKILTLLLLAIFSLLVSAQNLEQVFDMDKLAASKGFLLSQNNPNPFDGTTDVYLAVLSDAEVTMTVANIHGHIEAIYTGSFETGVHQFRIFLKAKGTYAMGAHQNGKSSSVVMLCNTGGGSNRIDYVGFVEEIDQRVVAEETCMEIRSTNTGCGEERDSESLCQSKQGRLKSEVLHPYCNRRFHAEKQCFVLYLHGGSRL